MFTVIYYVSYRKNCRKTFAKQLFAVHLLVEHLSMADSVNSERKFSTSQNVFTSRDATPPPSLLPRPSINAEPVKP